MIAAQELRLTSRVLVGQHVRVTSGLLKGCAGQIISAGENVVKVDFLGAMHATLAFSEVEFVQQGNCAFSCND